MSIPHHYFLSVLILLLGCNSSATDEGASPLTNCPPFASAVLPKQNTLYLGIDNPVTIATNNLNPQFISLVTSPPITVWGNGENYILRVERPGEQKVAVRYRAETIATFSFRARYLPTPTAYLADKTSGSLPVSTLITAPGIYAPLRVADLDVKCKIIGFELIRISSQNQRDRLYNEGGIFTGNTRLLLQMAVPGDNYQITNVKAKCPGDERLRLLNPLVFEIT